MLPNVFFQNLSTSYLVGIKLMVCKVTLNRAINYVYDVKLRLKDIGYVDGISSIVDFNISHVQYRIHDRGRLFSLCISLNLHYIKTGSN